MRSDWLSGGRYHGPSNEAGLTAAEYRETMDEYYAERYDALRDALDYDDNDGDECDDDE